MLPPAPPEPPRQAGLDLIAPWFQELLMRTITRGNELLEAHGYYYRFQPFETRRTDARQRWLYGASRTYRGGWLTNASSCYASWHGYGLAADVVPRILHSDGSAGDFTWDIPPGVWALLHQAASEHGCTTGLHWHSQDADHVQPANIRISPSIIALNTMHRGGVEAVWEICHPNGTPS